MQGNASRTTRAGVRMALLAVVATVALTLPSGVAQAVAPVLNSVDLPIYQNHPTFRWTLPTGDKGQIWSDHLVSSRSSDRYGPGTYLQGEFLDRNWVTFNTLAHTDTSFTDLREYKPGTYFVHVAGHDPGCPAGNFDCQIEFSNIMSFDVVAPPPPPKPGSSSKGDNVAPLQTLSFSAVQDVDKLRVTTRPSEAGTVSATGSVGTSGASRVYRLKGASKAVAANVKTTLRLKLSKKSLKAVKRALKKHKRLKAKVTVTATDSAKNKRSTKIVIGLRN